MKGIFIATAWAGLILSGCAVLNGEPVDFPVKPEEMTPYLAGGNGVVKGEAFLKQRGGGLVTCAGNTVYLVPATSYYRQRLDAVKAGGRVLPVTDQTADKVRLLSKCNSRGEFSFTDLAPGKWLVISEVEWEAGSAFQGGVVSSPVDVSNEKPAYVIVTD